MWVWVGVHASEHTAAANLGAIVFKVVLLAGTIEAPAVCALVSINIGTRGAIVHKRVAWALPQRALDGEEARVWCRLHTSAHAAQACVVLCARVAIRAVEPVWSGRVCAYTLKAGAWRAHSRYSTQQWNEDQEVGRKCALQVQQHCCSVPPPHTHTEREKERGEIHKIHTRARTCDMALIKGLAGDSLAEIHANTLAILTLVACGEDRVIVAIKAVFRRSALHA